MSELQSVIDKNVRIIEKQEAELRNACEQIDQMTAQSSDLQSQVLANPGLPGKWPLKRCMCIVSVYCFPCSQW